MAVDGSLKSMRKLLPLVAAGIAFSGLVHGQSRLTFEVATVKPADPGSRGSGFQFMPGGGIKIGNMNGKGMSSFAYDVRDFQISGATGWMTTARYDVLANPESGQGPAELKGLSDKKREEATQKIRERLQSLLADRFQLKTHKETKELPVYGLVVAKNGLKIEESKDGEDSPQNMNQSNSNGKMFLTGKRIPLQFLTMGLSNTLGRPVIDQTGLTGNYDFKMEWALDLGGRGPDFAGEKTDAGAVDPAGPSIFTAIQEQLGLRLESQKGPVEVIVIDRAEKASDN